MPGVIQINSKVKRFTIGLLKKIAILVIAGNLFPILLSRGWEINLYSIIIASFYALMLGLPLWLGNEFIRRTLNKKKIGIQDPLRRLQLELAIVFIYSTIIIIIAGHFWIRIFLPKPFEYHLMYEGRSKLISELIFLLLIVFAFYTYRFFKELMLAKQNEQQLKMEALSLQYEALKNQVNPHFLFNSLNILTSLVYEDKELAARFIKQLADIYRYVLENKDTELIEVEKELKFVNSYISLQQIRYGESLLVTIDEKLIKSNFMVIPVSIQMLVENALKHTIFTPEEPIILNIFADADNYITIENSYRPKPVVKDSTGIGLANLKKRYEYLSGKEFIISCSGQLFTIKMPIIIKQKTQTN